MPVNITDNSVFTDPIVAVADGDNVNATNTNVPVQGLSNRTRNLKNRVDTHDTTLTTHATTLSTHTATLATLAANDTAAVAAAARFEIGTASVAADDAFVLNADLSGTGITLTSAFGGHYVTLPSTLCTYLVTLHVALNTPTETTDTGTFRDVAIETSTATSFASPKVVDRARGYRYVYGSGSGAPIIIATSTIIRIADDGRYFRVRALNLSVDPVNQPIHWLSVARIAGP